MMMMSGFAWEYFIIVRDVNEKVSEQAMSRLWTDILVLWVAAFVLGFAAYLAEGFSLHDDSWEDRIGWLSPLLFLLAALVVTILQLIGIIGVW
jgi:hypothetical protein